MGVFIIIFSSVVASELFRAEEGQTKLKKAKTRAREREGRGGINRCVLTPERKETKGHEERMFSYLKFSIDTKMTRVHFLMLFFFFALLPLLHFSTVTKHNTHTNTLKWTRTIESVSPLGRLIRGVRHKYH